jgi:hypothetical protein
MYEDSTVPYAANTAAIVSPREAAATRFYSVFAESAANGRAKVPKRMMLVVMRLFRKSRLINMSQGVK